MAICKLITGPMFAGKTSRLLTECKTYAIHANKKCLLLKPDVDTRSSGDDIVFTHEKGNISTDGWAGVDTMTLPSDSCSVPNDIRKKYTMFGIDEGQFFTNLDQIVQGLMNANVVVAALNGQGSMSPWESVSKTLPYFNEIELVKSVCDKCKDWNASTTKMIVEEEEEEGGEEEGITIGGADKYIAMCTKCRFSEQ